MSHKITSYSNYMYLYYSMILILCMIFMIYDKTHLNMNLQWDLISFMDTSLVINLKMSSQSMIFMLTVSSIFASVYHYSLQYMEGELSVKRFLLTIILFVLSMMILICSGNMFTSLLGWDGLGVSSMLLIMFYSSNASLKASMYTFIINRLGDCFFLILIFMSFCLSSTLEPMNLNENIKMISLLIVIMSMTKSSQTPFSSWLTKAMEAPTPVSSLVHSSTLVTAGIYMLLIYKDLWFYSEEMKMVLCILSLTTLFLASLAGLMENDMKKIVAYSTLSQLGFIMFTFSLGLFKQGFFHLIMHAFFKAMMFMSAGYVIHYSSGWQDIRLMSLNKNCSPGIVKILMTAIMSLCGIPFLTGFYSKDQIIDSMSNFSIFLFVLVILSFLFTVLYSFRVCWFLMKGLKPLKTISDDSTIMYNSMMLLFMLSCIMGSVLSWTTIPMFLGCDFPKILILIYMIVTMLIFWNFSHIKISSLFMKSNLYLYIIVNLIVYKFSMLSKKIFWVNDLLGLMGKYLKIPSNMMVAHDHKNKNYHGMIYNLKEFFMFFIIIMIVGMMIYN